MSEQMLKRHRPGLATWILVRVTGLLLTVLVIGHFAITHIITDVAETGSGFVAERWASATVLAWDWIMLAAAVLHGAAGLRLTIDEYATGSLRRRLQLGLVWLSTMMIGVGTWTILQVILR